MCRPMLSKLTEKTSCFPGDATVQMQDGSRKMMSELEIGDVVRTGFSTYDMIENWFHRNDNVTSEMLEVVVDAYGLEFKMIASHDHIVPTGRGHIKMSELIVGDSMKTEMRDGRIVSITDVTTHGVYAPYTKSGYIMVDDVLATVYAKYMPSEYGREWLDYFMNISFVSCSTDDGMHCVPFLFMHVMDFIQSLIMSK